MKILDLIFGRAKTMKFDRTQVIDISSNNDANYEHFLNEIKNGATQFRIIEDKESNRKYDMDDLEDHYCYLMIQLYYKDLNKSYNRYRIMGEIKNVCYAWRLIDPNMTKEQLSSFLERLRKMETRFWF